jgi:hypothetical protein
MVVLPARKRRDQPMKNFLVVYIGTEAALARWKDLDDEQRRAREAEGIRAWMAWGKTNAAVIVENGSPVGRTKRVSPQGIADMRNALTGYTVVRAPSHEAAAKLFENHPHFTIFPGDSVEIMECLPTPGE